VDALSILTALHRHGVEVRAAGNRLQVRPAEAVPPDLLAELRIHKEELRLRLRAAGRVADVLGGVQPAHESTAEETVCEMQLAVFSTARLVVEVWSYLLGEVVVLASDNARLDPGELRPVYRSHELLVLLGLNNPRELRRIHEVKKTFRGTITDSAADASEK
jgi:hypothetical protein